MLEINEETMTLTDSEKAEIRKICDAKQVQASAQLDVFEAVDDGKTTLGGLAKWLDDQRQVLPPLFVDLTVIDLEARAFGEANMTARGQLIRSMGEPAALTRAKEWGLRGLTGRKRGTRPSNAERHERQTEEAIGRQSLEPRGMECHEAALLVACAALGKVRASP